MTDDEAKTLMERYGITSVSRTLYRFQGFSYANLTDALNYADAVTSRAEELTPTKAEPTN